MGSSLQLLSPGVPNGDVLAGLVEATRSWCTTWCYVSPAVYISVEFRKSWDGFVVVGGGCLCWDSPPHPVKDLGSIKLRFLAFCTASLSQGLEIHHSLYNYPSVPS